MQPRAATMRTSDAERQRVAELLRDACGEGRLTPEELEERLDRLFAGTTVADITVLVRDLPGGGAVIPRHGRGPAPRHVVRPVPARRRGVSPAVPLGVVLLVGGLAWLALGMLPPLLAIVFAAVMLSIAIGVGLIAVAMAPVGLALFGIAWLIHRVLRGPGRPPRWAGRHQPFR
jgi:Domain of unknown function (DUF1707)